MKFRWMNYPKWCRCLLIVAYALPLPIAAVFAILVPLDDGFFYCLLTFVPHSLLMFFLLFPLWGIYYAALTFIHTLIDEIWFSSIPKWMRVINVFISLACSSLLLFTTIQFVLNIEGKYWWIPLIFMLIGFAAIWGFFVSRTKKELEFANHQRENGL